MPDLLAISKNVCAGTIRVLESCEVVDDCIEDESGADRLGGDGGAAFPSDWRRKVNDRASLFSLERSWRFTYERRALTPLEVNLSASKELWLRENDSQCVASVLAVMWNSLQILIAR